MKTKLLGVVAGALLSVAATTGANAEFIANIDQVGNDVVLTGSGTIDLAGLHAANCPCDIAEAGIDPGTGVLYIAPGLEDAYRGATGPLTFGTGGFTPASSSSGDVVGIEPGIEPGNPYISVPTTYVSGNLLSDSMTFDNATFASLGLTPGIYTYSWSSPDEADDSFVINVGTTPLPATFPLFASGLGVIGLLAWSRTRKTEQFA